MIYGHLFCIGKCPSRCHKIYIYTEYLNCGFRIYYKCKQMASNLISAVFNVPFVMSPSQMLICIMFIVKCEYVLYEMLTANAIILKFGWFKWSSCLLIVIGSNLRFQQCFRTYLFTANQSLLITLWHRAKPQLVIVAYFGQADNVFLGIDHIFLFN